MPAISHHFPVKVARQPIIILGMHRSGTSMVCEMLEKLGVFVGRDLEDNHESTFFVELSNQLLHRSGATWDHPKPILEFFDCDQAARMSMLALAADVTSKRNHSYIGRGKFQSLDKPWGWKDPRVVFTLPAWLGLFPNARLIYIVRHGIDVAKSLVVRERKLLDTRIKRFDKRMNTFSFRSSMDRAAYKGSPRCLKMEGAFNLWEEYVEQAEENLRVLPNPILRLRYEDIISDPNKQLQNLVSFCELNASPEQIDAAATQINGSRAMAFANDPVSAAFYESVKANPWLARLGY